MLRLHSFDPQEGMPRDVPLRFVEEAGRVYVLARNRPLPVWAKTILAAPLVQWQIGDREFVGRARVITDPASLENRVALRLREEVGPTQFRQWFGSDYMGFVFDKDVNGPEGYAGRVEALFDSLAGGYDRSVAENPLDRKLRDVTLPILLQRFRPGERVLEIGCGTGLETIPLAAHGIRVLATDISEKMLDQLRRKATSQGLEDLIGTRHLAASDIRTLTDEFGPHSFAGAFSDFGALNCDEDPATTARALADLVAPGGSLVLAVWNRFCAWEFLAYALRLRPRRAFARLRRPVPVGLSRFGVPVYSYDSGSFVRWLKPAFTTERITGLPVFVPPYDFVRHLLPKKELLALLEEVDGKFAGRFPLSRLGDHFVLEMRRR